MKTWHSSSTESKPCAKCGRRTSTFKVYEQTSIAVRVPLCDNDYEKRHCYREVTLDEIADISIKLMKREIKESQ